ncbi:MAG: hypothetical protein LBL72_07370 [Candidatus Accumulibacter sp.]|jgi:hypothetical protein|nr:hypothetical protein [Accumulibacter sp.]
MKKNLFANFSDALSNPDERTGILYIIASIIFIWAWIRFDSFGAALLVMLIAGPTLTGVVMVFLGAVSMIFEHREEDGDTLKSFIGNFLFGGLLLLISCGWIYWLFILI